jgi:hypothetical protein
VNNPASYNNQSITVEGYYFSGFEIAALASALAPSTYNPKRVTPVQPLIWIEGNLGQNVYDNLSLQSDTPSGYAERYGKVRVTGVFHYGGKYGHLDAYQFKMTVSAAELLN